MWRRRLARNAGGGAGLLAGALLTGCASTGEPIEALQRAEAAYQQAANTPRIYEFGDRALNQARRHLEQARAADGREAVEHYSFLVSQHVGVAEARLRRGLTQEAIGEADQRRQALLLEAEERQTARVREEALAARQRAEQAEQELVQTRQQLEQARREAQTLAQELDELEVAQDERGMVYTLSDVVFDFDSAQLNEGGERAVARIAETIAETAEGEIRVEGYTDAIGSEEYNLELSERRAQAVEQAFVEEGIAAERITTEGYGEQYPVATNETDQGRQLNRRVEIIVATDGRTGEELARRDGSG
jgi:outer membrane protein OmpA-like peptidoglycan-associated protein